MTRYIDADKFAERIKLSPAFKNMAFEGDLLQKVVLDLLDNAPAADVVEVVRCKDCLNCLKVNDLDNGHWECIAHYDLHGKPYIPDLDGFCSYGERK